MLEFLACSLITILPDFLFRRYAQGKRMGIEINLFTVWYELRWGITACIILTLALITIIFFYHPTTSNVSSMYRTVSILPEAGGRVEKVLVENESFVKSGDLLFTLDSSVEQATVDTSRKRIKEVDADLVLAISELAAAKGLVAQAQGAYDQAINDLERNRKLIAKSVVSARQVETLENLVVGKKGALDSAIANK
jgi:multidrug resistance efflux pump